MDAKLSRFFNRDKSLMASVSPNLFGSGVVVSLHTLGRSGEYHRTGIKYVVQKRPSAVSFAKKLVEYGVAL